MLGSALHEFLASVSLGLCVDTLDVKKALGSGVSWYSPMRELHLLGTYTDPEPTLALLRLDAPLTCTEHTSQRPVHEAFFAALEIAPAASGDVRPTVTEFLARERAREAESSTRELYGRDAKVDRILDAIDFPVFDNGTLCVGFGLALGFDGRRWLWSRPYFAHK